MTEKQVPNFWHLNIWIFLGLGVLTFGLPLGGILVSAYLDNFSRYIRFPNIAGGYS
jgi:hypothetical protein